MFKFSCQRFSRLLSESRDRELTHGEEGFLSSHALRCTPCAKLESQTFDCLAELRGATLDLQPSEGFGDGVVAAFREGRKSLGFGYWSPAVMGAAIAGIAVLCALTIVTKTVESPVRRSNIGAATRFGHVANPFPALNLDSAPRQLR